MSRIVHCHIPITVRVHGVPDDDTIQEFAAAVRRQVASRVASAERVLAARCRPPSWAGGRAERTSPAEPREPYDVRRDGPDGYAVPSYDHRGEPVAVPVRRRFLPGRDWRVLRALTITLTVRVFLDYVQTVVGGRHPDQPVLPGRVVFADLETEQRTVTVWLVQAQTNATLAELLADVSARAAELMRLPANRDIAGAMSPFDGDRQALARLDATGRISGLPALTHRNARRVRGAGAATELLHGAVLIYAAMPLPRIEPGMLLDVGRVATLTIPVADLEFCLDPNGFAANLGLTWPAYTAEAGARPARLDLLPTRVRADSPIEAVRYLADAAYRESGSIAPVGPDLVAAAQLVDADDADAPSPVAGAGLDFATGLPALPAQTAPRHGAGGERVDAGTIAVLATAYLPVDVETLAAARLRPVARRLAAQARALSARDTGDRQWKYDCYDWLGRSFGESPEETRPPGGTIFEYVLAELDASHDLDPFIAAVAAADWEPVPVRFVRLAAPTRFATRPAVVALLRRLRAATLAGYENSYHDTVDANDPGGIDLDHDPRQRITPAVPGRSVLGDVDSIYVFERRVRSMKPAAADRLRAALIQARRQLLAEIAAGTISRTLSPDDFLREAIGRAARTARITDDDDEKLTIQRSMRVLELHRRDIGLLPSWDVTVQFVDRVKGTGQWLPIGRSRTVPAGEFEADLVYWRLGRAGEVYQAMAIGISLVGGIAVAWEAGLISALATAAGGTTAALTSIAIGELIYLVRVIFFDAELSLEGFLMAAVDGYLMAVGFRAGTLAAAPLGRSLGTASVRRVWTGIVLEKLATGAVGGALSAGLELFAHDVVDVIAHDGEFHAAAAYIRRIGVGAAVGVLGEFTVAPIGRRLTDRAVAALGAASDVVRRLRQEGFSVAEFAASATESLANLRRCLGSICADGAVAEYLGAFRGRVEEMLTAWGPGVVARRVLELSGANLTGPAADGLARFLQAAEQPGAQDAALRLARTFAEHPQETVHLLEVLSVLDEGVARRMMTGTFGSPADLAAFIGRLGRYGADDQRAALDLLGQLIDRTGAVARPSLSGTPPAQVREAQLAAALRIQSRAARLDADRLRREARGILDDAVRADAYSRRRADALLDQAARLEREAAEREEVGAALASGVDPRPTGQRIPSLTAGRPGPPDPSLDPGFDARFDAELDRAFRRLVDGDVPAPPWIRLTASRTLGTEEADYLVRSVFSSRSGNPVVFRVEGGAGADRSWEFVQIGRDGGVKISTGGRDLNLNIGSLERAIEFIVEHRPGARLKVFEVEAGWLRSLRGSAVPERGVPAALNAVDPGTGATTRLTPTGSLSDVRGLARTVDVRFAADQLQLDGSLIGELGEFVVPGSGRVLEFVPGPARVRAR